MKTSRMGGRLRYITLGVFVVFQRGLLGCTPLQRPDPPAPVAPTFAQKVAQAEAAYQQQAYGQAAALYRELAEQAAATQRDGLLLRSADAELQAPTSNVQWVRHTLQDLASTAFVGEEALLYQVLQVELAQLEGTSGQATWDSTSSLWPSAETNPVLSQRLYRALLNVPTTLVLRAQILAAFEALLLDSTEQIAMQLELLHTLSQLGRRRLEQLTGTDTLPGWIQLALLGQRYTNDKLGLQAAIPAWQTEYPEHPALLAPLLARWQEWSLTVAMPRHVAILLPLSGRYAPVAEALRAGIQLSLDSLPTAQPPTLQYYDTQAQPDIHALYQQAVAEGAEWIIGPLQKEALTHLLQLVELPVPVLALNEIALAELALPNFYMYALNPADEARQAAERIWLDEKRQPMVLVPENAWGDRILAAFQAHWATLSGGDTPVFQQYAPKGYDHSEAITRLLLIDKSQQRYRSIQGWLPQFPLAFTPYRRADVDAIFLAVRGAQAQGFAPQLKFHQAGELPLYTTSHSWTGQLTQRQLVDMRGIYLPDIPLFSAPEVLQVVREQIPNWQPQLVRFYAMGMDALNLLPHVTRLQRDPAAVLEGQTGLLFMDTTQRIHRQLPWLQLDEPVRLITPAALMSPQVAVDNASALTDDTVP